MSELATLWETADGDPTLAKALREFGLTTKYDLNGLYKVYEVLAKGAGGRRTLPDRTGVSELEINQLTATCNNHRFSGDAARHAEQQGRDDPDEYEVSVAEVERIAVALLRGWVEKS